MKTPENLDEAIQWLKDNIPEQEQKDISNEELDAHVGHHTIGHLMRNKWGLWSGSKLQEFFHNLGIRHADDMSGIILESFQRELRDEEIKLQQQVEKYRNYWERKGTNPDEIGKQL